MEAVFAQLRLLAIRKGVFLPFFVLESIASHILVESFIRLDPCHFSFLLLFLIVLPIINVLFVVPLHLLHQFQFGLDCHLSILHFCPFSSVPAGQPGVKNP
jgi:hypothetical protein